MEYKTNVQMRMIGLQRFYILTKQIKMSKVLITGWAWFVGSHLAEYCMDRWHEVVVVDDLSWWFERNIPNWVSFYKVDITNAVELHRVFDIERPDYVYHLACFAAEWLSHFIRSFIVKNVFMWSTNVINECIKYKVKRLIFTH